MGYAEEYKQKLVTAAQAAAVIQDGDWVCEDLRRYPDARA